MEEPIVNAPKKCPNCEAPVAAKWKVCPECESPLQAPAPETNTEQMIALLEADRQNVIDIRKDAERVVASLVQRENDLNELIKQLKEQEQAAARQSAPAPAQRQDDPFEDEQPAAQPRDWLDEPDDRPLGQRTLHEGNQPPIDPRPRPAPRPQAQRPAPPRSIPAREALSHDFGWIPGVKKLLGKQDDDN